MAAGRYFGAAAFAAALSSAAPVLAAAHGSLPLRQVARVPLPGPSNRFDYQSVDSSAHRLYISHMDGDRLLVFDLRRRKVLRAIAAPGVHGVLVVPRLERVFASATNVREVFTLDAKTYRVLARAPAGQYPDGIAYDPVERRVFVSDESGGVETVLDAAGRHVATIALGGEAGNVQYDPASRMVLVDVQTDDVIAFISPRDDRIVARLSVPGCANDHGLLIDTERRLAFVACDGNATLHILDLRARRFIGSATVGAGPDVLAFDASLRRLYVAAESGVVSVFQEKARGLKKLGEAFLAPHAHTVAVDPQTHLVYFPLESGSAGRPQLLIMAPVGG